MYAIGRLFTSCSPNRLADRRTLRHAGFAFILLLLAGIAAPRNAQAATDPVDFAVDAAVYVGNIAGVPIPPSAAGIAKELVRCAVQGKSAGDCARASVVKTVLKEVPAEGQKLVDCVLSGQNVAACGGDAVLEKVPEAARPLARCIIDGGNVAGCAEKFAIDQVGGAIDGATKQATDEVLKALKDIKADAEDAMRNLPPAVRNIMTLVEGIEKSDWEKMVEGGGPIVAKVVISTIINVVLTPAFAPIIGPVVDVMVQNRADLIFGILKAVKEGDAVLVGEIVFQFYLTTMIEGACALIPDGAFKDATCGNLAKAIAGVVGAVGDVVDAILKGIGAVGEAIVDLFKDIFGDGLEDPEVCGTTKDFFSNNYMPCMGSAAGDAPAAFSVTTAANGACRSNFNKCYGDRTGGMCSAMGSAFNDQVRQLNAAIADGANTITSASLGAYLSQRKAQLCRFGYSGRIDSAIEDFLGTECTDTLSKILPLPVNACNFKPPHMKGSRGYLSACLKAAGTGPARDQMNQVCAAHCRDNPDGCQPPPVCTDPMTGKTFSYTGPFAEQMSCPPLIKAVPQVKFDWNDLFGKDKPIPQIVVNDPGRLGWGRGNVGKFVIDGSGNSVAMNDALSDRFISGKCKLRAKTANLIMYLDPTPSTGWGRMSVKTASLISLGGFGDCTIGSAVAKFNDDYVRWKRTPKKDTVITPRKDTVKLPTGSGGAYPSYSPGGGSAIDRAAGATAGSTAIGSVRGPDVKFDGGGRPIPCPACGSKVGAKPSDKPSTPSGGSGGIYLTKPGGQSVPRPTPPARSGPDPNIDYGGVSRPPPGWYPGAPK